MQGYALRTIGGSVTTGDWLFSLQRMDDKKELEGDSLNEALRSFTAHFQPFKNGTSQFLGTYDIIHKILTLYPGYYIDSIKINKLLKDTGFIQALDTEDLSLKWKVEVTASGV